MSVEFADNSGKVLTEFQKKKLRALEGAGGTAVSYTKQNIDAAGRVDTGALISSINHLVRGDTCYIGTNISYAIFHELGTGVHIQGGRKTPWAYKDADGNWHRTSGVKPVHFLRNAVQDHQQQLKAIIRKYMR